MAISFKRAYKAQSFLRMAIAGPSGSGKTYTSLEIAVGLAAGRPIAVIDTERGSASKYADLFTFDVLELDAFHPERYIEALEAASAAGYAVLVIDSLSHGWNGVGGALELHDQAVKRQKTQNSYTAWADITPLQNRLINAITGAPLHVIATMRSKTEYVQDRNERGGTTIRKVGMAPIQRDGMEYEFDVFGQMDVDHNLIIEKSRCSALASAVIAHPGAPLAETLAQWLQGDTTAPVTTPVTTPVAQQAHPSQVQPSQAARPRAAAKPQPQQQATAATVEATANVSSLTLPKWQALAADARALGLSDQDWRTTISTITGKTADLTDDDKRTMLAWLRNRHAQLKQVDAATPDLASLEFVGN